MNQLIALILGIVNTLAIHFAKVMQRYGIQAVTGRSKSVRLKLIYWAGFMLTNTSFIWIMIANEYAAPSYATSMFGLGIIALMITSRIVLKEQLTKRHFTGAFILVIGTLVLGYDGITQPITSLSDINLSTVWLFIGVFLVGVFTALLLSLRGKSTWLIGVTFGIVAGGLGGLDPVLKGIGQQFGGIVGLLPQNPEGRLPFVLSFFFGSGAFFTVQWGFHRRADASVIAPFHAALYVLMPQLVQLLAMPGYSLTHLRLAGMLVTTGGVFLAAAPRRRAGGTAPVEAESGAALAATEWPFSPEIELGIKPKIPVGRKVRRAKRY